MKFKNVWPQAVNKKIRRTRTSAYSVANWLRTGNNGRNLLVALTLSGLALAAIGFSYTISRQQQIVRLQKPLESQARLIGAKLFAPVDKYSYLPNVLSQEKWVVDVLTDLKDPARVTAANEFLENLNKAAGSTTLYLLDLEGTTVASSNWKDPNSFIGKNYAFRPYFINALRNGEDRFYAKGITSKIPGYYISRLVKKNNMPIGVAVTKVDIRNLGIEWDDAKGQKINVIDENGVIFLTSHPDWQYRPMQPLSASVQNQLARTRQYDGALQASLWVEFEETVAPNSQILRISDDEKPWYWLGKWDTAYLVKRHAMPNASWTVSVLIPMDEINAQARRTAIMAAGATLILVLLFMYARLVRARLREREESRQSLEQAHLALAQKHEDLQAVSEELRIKSVTDVLTGIYNRRFFLDSAARLVSAANRHHVPLSVIMIDVDHFKQINDQHGHPAGDAVLQALASLYKEEMREADVLARFGGEEFIIALPHTDAQSALIVAERIRAKVMKQQVVIDSGSLAVTISCGVSQHRRDETAIDDTIRRADEALYESKKNGRNQVRIK